MALQRFYIHSFPYSCPSCEGIAVESRSDYLRERLRDLGLRITPQRMAVLNSIGNRRNHPTQIQILRDVKEKYPTTARSTILNTLRILEEVGEIRELKLGDGTVRICSKGDPHAHIICKRCGEIRDFRGEKVNSLQKTVDQESGYRITDSDIKFYGVCEHCG
jgi:Fur family peroxide stress response transcriptional regulator